MDQFAKETLPVSLEEEMRRSYLDYAMSVIVARALPDVRDGLKPVHRRGLFRLHAGGGEAARPHQKRGPLRGGGEGAGPPPRGPPLYHKPPPLPPPVSLGHPPPPRDGK